MTKDQESSRLKLKRIIETVAEYSYEYIDFFPKQRAKTPEGRFELLALSILDVNRYNAERLWYHVALNLRQRDILSLNYLTSNSENEINIQLKNAGYNRGNYTLVFAKRLKGLAIRVSQPPFNGDISNMFTRYKSNQHNKQTIKETIRVLRNLPGLGQKVSTMFTKFMFSYFNEWKWQGDESSLCIAPAIDFQVKKVYIRLGNEVTGDFEQDLNRFCTGTRTSFIKVDDVFWNVGNIFCNSIPKCHYCVFKSCCKYAEYRRNRNFNEMNQMNECVQRYTN
jgi:endonuclease III